MVSMVAAIFTACGDDSSTNSSSDNNTADRLNDNTTYYYQIDTVEHQIRMHSTGRCKIITGSKYEWDKSADVNELLYNYTLSNDTLYLKKNDESVLVRTSGTTGSLDGTWKVVRYYNGLGYEVPGESSGLTANRVITISGDKFEETAEIASTFDFTNTMGFQMSLNAIINAQDGMYNGPGEASFSNFIGPESTDPVVYKAATNEILVINRTNTSLEFTRKDKTFLMEIIDPILGSSGMSISYRVSSNGISCTSNYEEFSIREEECDWEVPEALRFNNSDGIIFSAEKINRIDFDKCFQTLFE